MLVLLAVLNDRLVPSPLGLNVGPVLSLGGVELGELVALVVGSDIKDRLELVAADNEGSLNNGVVVLAVYGSAAEHVLARTLHTGVESTNQVVGHEGEGELIVVLVLALPDGVLGEGNVLPEPLHGVGLIVVGVVAFPLIQSESGTGKCLEGVLGLGSLSSGLLLLGSLGGGLLGLLLGLLGLLGGNVGELRGVEELELGGDGGVDGLVVDSGVPPGDVGVLGAPLGVEEELEATGDDASGEEVGQGDALANEVGVVLEVLLNGSKGLRGSLGSVVDGLLVVGVTADQRAVPLAHVGEDLGLYHFKVSELNDFEERSDIETHVEVAHPLQNGGVVLLGLAEQSGLLILGLDTTISYIQGLAFSSSLVAEVSQTGRCSTRDRHTVTVCKLAWVLLTKFVADVGDGHCDQKGTLSTNYLFSQG